MFKRLLITSFFFCSAAMAQTHTYYIPQFAAGAASGLSITTSGTIVNLGTQTQLTSPIAALNSPDSGGTAEVTREVYNEFGEFFDSGSFTLAPGERTAQNWNQLIPSLAGVNGFRGSAEITSTVPVFMLPLRQDRVQLTTRDALDARSSQ